MSAGFLGGLLLLLAILLVFFLGRRRGVPVKSGESQAGASLPEVKEIFTFAIYNIHRARGLDGRKDLARISGVIAKADIIGLCEVEGAPVIGGADQCHKLGNLLGCSALFSPTQRRWGRYDRGNGLLLNRIPLTSWYQEPLHDSTGTHPRSLLRADIKFPEGEVAVFVTHLARRIDQAVQLEVVMQRFRQYDRAILMGDFNLTRSSPLIRKILADGKTDDAISLALEQDDPERIDWIFTRGITVTGGEVHPPGPSDHPCYQVQLRCA